MRKRPLDESNELELGDLVARSPWLSEQINESF